MGHLFEEAAWAWGAEHVSTGTERHGTVHIKAYQCQHQAACHYVCDCSALQWGLESAVVIC